MEVQNPPDRYRKLYGLINTRQNNRNERRWRSKTEENDGWKKEIQNDFVRSWKQQKVCVVLIRWRGGVANRWLPSALSMTSPVLHLSVNVADMSHDVKHTHLLWFTLNYKLKAHKHVSVWKTTSQLGRWEQMSMHPPMESGYRDKDSPTSCSSLHSPPFSCTLLILTHLPSLCSHYLAF